MPKKQAQDEPETMTRIHAGLEELQPMLETVEERGKEFLDALAEEIKKQPIRSIAIAAGVGFVLAKLFSGRGRHS